MAKRTFGELLDKKRRALILYRQNRVSKTIYDKAVADVEEAKSSIATYAKVPTKYLDNLWIEVEPSSTHVYYGGKPRPYLGNHGHHVISFDGRVTYMRRPGQKHGQKNHLIPLRRCKPKRRR